MGCLVSCNNKINKEDLDFVKTRRWKFAGGFYAGDIIAIDTIYDKLIGDTIVKKSKKIAVISKLESDHSRIIIKSLSSNNEGFYVDYGAR